MFKCLSPDRKAVCVSLVFMLLTAGSLWAFSEERQRQPRQRPQRLSRDQVLAERNALSEEALSGFQDVQTVLKEILTAVNQNHRPEPLQIQNAQQVLDENKRYFRDYQDNQQAAYMLLQAWTSYYEDDQDTAVNWALRAAKTDETNGDAWVSGAVFCMLNDKKPVLPRIPKAAPQRSRRNGEELGVYETSRPTGPNIQKGTLDFDVLSLRAELFTQRADLVDFKKMEGGPSEYDPANDTLCVMFWKSEGVASEEMVSDPNEPARKASPHQGATEMLMMEMPPMGGFGLGQTQSLDQQRQYFKQMARVCKGQKSLAFYQVNVDPLEQAKKVALEEVTEEKMIQELKDGTYVPLVFAAQHLDISQCAPLVENGPLMLIVAPGGKLRYAGPAAHFAPAFIVTAETGIEIDLQQLNKTPQAAMSPYMMEMMEPGQRQPVDPLMMEMMGMGSYPQAQPKPVVDPNKMADPNVPAGNPVKPAAAQPAKPAPAQPQELTVEDCVKAEKLLAEAQLKIEACRKLPSPKKAEEGIEACRKVLADYPNTEYAEQAREWLRKVPYRFKKDFDVTNEELGY